MLTFRRYEYLCRIAAGGNSADDWMSVTALMAAVRAERIAVHQAIRDLKAAGLIKRRKNGGRIEVAITTAGNLAVRRFFEKATLLFASQRRSRDVPRRRP